MPFLSLSNDILFARTFPLRPKAPAVVRPFEIGTELRWTSPCCIWWQENSALQSADIWQFFFLRHAGSFCPIKLKLRCQATAGSFRPWSCLFQILIWTDRRHLHSFHFPFWTLHLWRFESFCILSSDICCMLWNLYAINSIGTRHVCPETNVVDKLLEGGAQLPDGFVSLCLCTV